MKSLIWKYIVAALAFIALFISTPALLTTAKSKPSKPTTRGNLEQLQNALMMYLQDYDDRFPPMQNAVVITRVLHPYVNHQSAFIDPVTKKSFAFNASLSHRPLEKVWKEGYEKNQGIVAIYQATSAESGGRYVVRMAKPAQYIDDQPVWAYTGENDTFWNSFIEKIPRDQWPATKKASNIP